MNNFIVRLSAALLYCLLSAQGWADSGEIGPTKMDGQELARALNQRLASEPARCLNDQPDYACSGVLARPMGDAHQVNFWLHDADAIARGSERFVYLRRDITSVPDVGRTGYILMNHLEAIAVGKPYEIQARPARNEVLVRNWDVQAESPLALQALYYRWSDSTTATTPDPLLRGQRSQRAWYQATGQWLPLLRLQDGTFGFDIREQLYNGIEIAEQINQRYADTTEQCAGGSARYHCNGVWVRTTGVGDFKAWNPSPASQRNGAVSFSYFAADAAVNITIWPQGFVLFPTAYPVRRKIELRCSYPFDGGTTPTMEPCSHRKECAAAGITSFEAWMGSYGSNPHTSCAFGIDAQAFQLSLRVRHQIVQNPPPDVSPHGWNEPVMRTWEQNVVAELPLEAFIYSLNVYYQPPVTSPMPEYGINNAKRFQGEYVVETRRYLPVLRLDPAAPGGKLVTYRLEDQLVQ